MKVFLDTSVLVATFYADHEHHPSSIDLFLRFGKKYACCGAHSLAEVYATSTSMPGKRRVSGDEALLFLSDIRERLMLVALDDQEYFQVAEASARRVSPAARFATRSSATARSRPGPRLSTHGTQRISSGCPRLSPAA